MREKMFYVMVGVAACAVAGLVFGQFMPVKPAQAQGSGANSITLGLGEVHRGVFPVVVVDSVDNSILLYEADISRTRWELELKNARTYRYDKQIRELNTEPPIGQVRERLDRQRRGN